MAVDKLFRINIGLMGDNRFIDLALQPQSTAPMPKDSLFWADNSSGTIVLKMYDGTSFVQISHLIDDTTSSASTTYSSQEIDSKFSSFIQGGSYRGPWDASTGSMPTNGSGAAGAVRAGDTWRVSIAGNFGGIEYEVGDLLIADVDNATLQNQFTLFEHNLTYTPEDVANKDTDPALGGGSASDVKYPSQKAARTAIDSAVANKVVRANLYGQNNLKAFDANGDDLDTGIQVVQFDPTLGGASQDRVPTQADTKAYVDSAVNGKLNTPVGSMTTGHLVSWDGSTVQDAGVVVSTDGTLASNSDAKIATEKAVKAYVDAHASSATKYAASFTAGNFSSGVLTITHSLNTKDVVYSIYDPSDILMNDVVVSNTATVNTIQVSVNTGGEFSGRVVVHKI